MTDLNIDDDDQEEGCGWRSTISRECDGCRWRTPDEIETDWNDGD